MEYISGHAVFTPDGNVKVGEDLYTAKHILIACGGRPLIPNIPGGSLKLDYGHFKRCSVSPFEWTSSRVTAL